MQMYKTCSNQMGLLLGMLGVRLTQGAAKIRLTRIRSGLCSCLIRLASVSALRFSDSDVAMPSFHSDLHLMPLSSYSVTKIRVSTADRICRFSYCALSCCSLLNRLDAISVPKAVDFLVACRNFDGGFGCTPGDQHHYT